VLTLWCVVGLASCGGGETTTTIVTVQAPATATAAPAKSSSRCGALATYEPSSVISDAGGWETITRRGNEGVHISTYTRGSGSGATISTHPI
jgi:hypothetical protein